MNTNYRNRIKSAWLVLTGRAYAIPYATIYQDYLYWTESGAHPIKMSDVYDPKVWEVRK